MLVLEYGGADHSIYIQMPSALSIPMNMPKYNWFYHTEPEPHLNGRRMHTPRGKVLGGSSSINGLVYIRGNPEDFERWAQEGAAGWSYRDVLPYFKRAERRAEGGDRYRGDAGKLHTSYGTLANPLHAAWLAAGEQAGYPRTQDVNGFQQEGFGRMDMTVGDGSRCSAARAYLRPAMHRPNLKVLTHALATRIEFEGRRARGLTYERGGRSHRVRIEREVILCAGPINSPQLLKLSGIGPGGGALRARHPGGARSAGRRRELAGSPRVLLPGGVQGADHPVLLDQLAQPRADRRALDPAQGRVGRHQSLRDLRIHPQPAGDRIPRHPVSLPADGGRVRRIDAGPGARISGARGADALEEPRLACGSSRPIPARSPPFASIT